MLFKKTKPDDILI